MATGTDFKQLEKLLSQMNMFTREPEKFLSEQPQLTPKVKKHTKSLYDTLKKHDPPDRNTDALPELIIDNFDDEQIWQEIELQNTPSVNYFVSDISKILAAKDRLTFDSKPENVDSESESEYIEEDINEEEDLDDSAEEESDSDLDEDLSALHPPEEEDSDADLERLLDQAEAGGFHDDMEADDGNEEEEAEEEEEEEKPISSRKKKSKTSVVDDEFFKLSEMEEFLTQEDLREERRLAGKVGEDEEDEEEDDEDDEEAEEDKNAMYADFFGDAPPDRRKDGKKSVHFDMEGDDEDKKDEKPEKRKKLLDSDSEGEDADDILGRKHKSTFEERQEKMQKKIASLESANLATKEWQMGGEVGAASRPENSLLAEDLDFDHTSKLPPVITEETTLSLEEIIKQRIKDKAWDDVERKVKNKEDPFEYKKRITLSQEKSKQSLSEIYAQEYMKQNEAEDKEKEKDPKHAEIEKMMTSLFVKLDALSNFHYTPKAAVAEVEIVTNMPTISLEEVAPTSVTDGQLLAPEEIKAKQRGALVGDSERSQTDKLRQRRQKKSEKRKRIRDKEKRQKLVEKANPGLGNKYSKEKAMQQLEKDAKTQTGVSVIKEKGSANKNISSKQFFQQLQDEVTTQMKSKKSSKKKKEKPKSSKNFML